MKFNNSKGSNMVILFIVTLALLAVIPIYVHKAWPYLSQAPVIDTKVLMPLQRDTEKSSIPLHFVAKNSNKSMRTNLVKNATCLREIGCLIWTCHITQMRPNV